MNTLPNIALSIRQPWCWLILHAGKDIENRNWRTNFRGKFLIHAAGGMTRDEYIVAFHFARKIDERAISMPGRMQLERGGIVGEVEIVDCVRRSDSPWFVGEYGFVLRNAKVLPFRQCKWKLGFFRPEL